MDKNIIHLGYGLTTSKNITHNIKYVSNLNIEKSELIYNNHIIMIMIIIMITVVKIMIVITIIIIRLKL